MAAPARFALLTLGCVVLGIGVGLLLLADLGSDGFSTLVNGVARSSGLPFWLCNLLVCVVFLAVAALRRVIPGVGTVVQILIVGGTVSLVLTIVDGPEGWPARIAVLVGAFPLLAVGVATYLGSRLGAGAAEAAALAWDPPVPFRWSYSIVQATSALLGWLLGATIGAGTVAVMVLLGPLVDLTARLLRLDVHQGDAD